MNVCWCHYICRDKHTPDVTLTSSSNADESIENIWSILTVGSCILFLISSHGISFSVSPFVVEWLETFDQGKEKTGWVGSVNMAVGSLTGLYIKALNMLDERKIYFLNNVRFNYFPDIKIYHHYDTFHYQWGHLVKYRFCIRWQSKLNFGCHLITHTLYV